MRFIVLLILTMVMIPPKTTLAPKPNPSLAPSPTIKPTQIPTSTPIPKPTPSPIPTIAPTPKPIQVSDYQVKKDYLMNAINDYRVSQGLAKVSTDAYTCDFAKIRVKEITAGFNHDGFRNRINSNSLPYPSFKAVKENISMNSNYQNVVPNWIASSSHAENLRADTKYGCIEFEGSYFVYLGWQP